MPNWGIPVIVGCFFVGLVIGFATAALCGGIANSELAQRNNQLDRENRALRTQLHIPTEDVAA